MRFVLILMMILSPAALAQVYKWTDENGTVHFGNQPPPGEQEEVRIRKSEPGSMGSRPAPDSGIMNQASELDRRESQESAREARERYRERVSEIREDYRESPDYICQGAKNRLKSTKERWRSKKRQGFTISEENYYEQRIRDLERHRDNICR